MQLATVPLPGRELRGPLSLRSLAFTQVCQRIGAPAPYLRGLPPKLQLAVVNWSLSRQQSSALLRLAGDEVRAVAEADLRSHARRLVTFFLEEHGDLPVLDTEARFEVELADTVTGGELPRPLVGYLDLVLADGRSSS